jgi:type II secretory pathway component PulL
VPLTAFFDMTSPHEGMLYVLDRQGRKVQDRQPFELREDGGLLLKEEAPAGVADSFLSLPLSLLNFRMLRLPWAEPEKIRDTLPYELEGLVLGSPEDYVLDFAVLGEQDGGHGVLVACLEKKTLRGILEALAGAGMDPRAVCSVQAAAVLETAPSPEALPGLLLEGVKIDERQRLLLAFKEMESPRVNLRRGEFSYTRETERVKRSLRLAALGAVLLALVLAGDLSLKAHAFKRDAARLEAQIMESYRTAFPSEKPASAQGLGYKMRARLSQLRAEDEALTGVDPLAVLMELQGAGLKGAVLREISMEKEVLVLKGEAATLSQVEHARSRLGELYPEVNLTGTGQSARDKVDFTITARGKKK